MKKTKDPFIKIRIILASIFLTIILGGWIIYGYTFIKTNPAKILTKLSNIEKQNINNNIDNIDFKSEKNYTISLNNDKYINLYINLPKNKLYLYNDKEYYNLLKDYNLSTNSKDYKNIFNSLIDSLTLNYKILDKNKKKDDKKGYYIYSYSLNELHPITNTLKTDKTFIDSLKKSFKLSDNKILELLNKYNDSSIGLNIVTEGKNRNIVYYNLKIDNLFSFYKENNYITGFFLDYGFTYDKNLTIYTEENEYQATIKENKEEFIISNYTENTSLEEVLAIIKQ